MFAPFECYLGASMSREMSQIAALTLTHCCLCSNFALMLAALVEDWRLKSS